MINKILVVCLGNVCRSPMAEGLLRHELASFSVEVSSAGINAMVGAPADPIAQELMLSKNIDIRAHRARQISLELLIENDLILVMENEQQKKLEFNFPNIYGRVRRLGTWSGFDITDPYRRPKQIFEQTLALIEHCVNDWKKCLLK